ncbi:hypothetical protein [Saliphagus sp. LR7]|uniref:hypothetical protein n=1 Tax=Saliphagus sp. LR7 TaxID=2282654 RepID=UPI0013007DED|nr:hypothetical protein [Saliphagus sp. LR7]
MATRNRRRTRPRDTIPPIEDALKSHTDDYPPLVHRTDRITLRNESQTPVVYVDDDPLMTLAPDAKTLQDDPLAIDLSDIRHQHYTVDAETLAESKTVVRDLIDQFDADTGRSFYYTIAGERAQIGGNGLDDYFEATENVRRIYTDLETQLDPPGERQRPGFPHGNQYMTARCIGLTAVEGVWLRFTIRLTESPDEEVYSWTSVSVTTLEQHGPLVTQWLDDRLSHPALGSPSTVDRQHTEAQERLLLGPGPLVNVSEHRLIGYRGRESPVECISCENPYYRPRTAADERNEQYDRLDDAGVTREVIPQLLSIDRFPLRPKGGSHGVDEDYFIGSEVALTRFGTGKGWGGDHVTLLSGKTTPVLKEEYAKQHQETTESDRNSKLGRSLRGVRNVLDFRGGRR